jgi:hypothetical protein
VGVRRAARVGLVSLLALAAVAAACVGEPRLSPHAYERAMAGAARRLEAAFQELAAASEFRASGPAGPLAARIREGAGVLREAAEDLAAIRPPEDARAAHDRLTKGMRDLAAAFEDLAGAVARGDLQEMRRFTERTRAGTLAIRGALEELRSLGYGQG